MGGVLIFGDSHEREYHMWGYEETSKPSLTTNQPIDWLELILYFFGGLFVIVSPSKRRRSFSIKKMIIWVLYQRNGGTKKILRFLDRQVAVEVTCNAAISACENSVEWMQVPEWRAGTGSGTWFLERDFSSKEINSIFQVSLFCVKFQGGIYIWYNRILKMAIDQNFILQSSFVLGAALFWTLFAPGSRVSSMFLDVDSQGSSSRNMLIVTGI